MIVTYAYIGPDVYRQEVELRDGRLEPVGSATISRVEPDPIPPTSADQHGGCAEIFRFGGVLWYGVPWPLRRPRPRLGHRFPWIMQPTLKAAGCGCPVACKSAVGAIIMAWQQWRSAMRIARASIADHTDAVDDEVVS